MKFSSTSFLQLSTTAANFGTGRWCLSFWMEKVSQFVSVGSQSADPGGGLNGWECEEFGTNKLNFSVFNAGAGTSISMASVIPVGLNHYLFFFDSGTLYMYLSGVLDASAALTDTGIGSSGVAVRVADRYVFGNTGSQNVNQFEMFNNMTMTDHAALAKIIFESQGKHNITDGLIVSGAGNYGPNGSTVGTTTNLGSAGGTWAPTNAPTYEAVALN